MIEDKDDAPDTMFSGYADISEYINNGYDVSRLYKCPIDDVLWYAEHLKSEKDVIAIANYSNGKPESFKSATFYFPKNRDFKDIKIVCEGDYKVALLSLSDYKTKISKFKGEIEHTSEQVYDDLRKYAEMSSKFFYHVGVDDADRLGLVSIIALALTNKKSDLYEKVTKGNQIINDEDIRKALLEDKDKTKHGVITDPQKGIPVDKIAVLREYIQKILITSHLTNQIDETLRDWDDNKDKSDKPLLGSLTNFNEIEKVPKYEMVFER